MDIVNDIKIQVKNGILKRGEKMKFENELNLDELGVVVGGMGKVYDHASGNDDPAQIGAKQYICGSCGYIGSYKSAKPVKCPKCMGFINGADMA